MKTSLMISVRGFVNLGAEEKCREFIDVLKKNNLNPLKFDTTEHPKYIFEIEHFVKFWTDMENQRGSGIIFIKGKEFYFSINWGGAKPYYSFLVISFNKIKNWDVIVSLARDIYEWNESCYGYIADKNDTSKLATPGYNIMDCLGGITWANFFGKPYVDMWGEEKLLKAPTWKTERLKDGGFLFLTAESPLNNLTAAGQAEGQLREYLGEKYFFKRPTQIERITREELYERVLGEHEPEVTGYVAPDFRKYYEI